MELPAASPLVDLICYGALLYALHQCVFRFPKVYIVLSVIILAKVAHTISPHSNIAWTGFHISLVASMLLGVFLARKSANFFWLFSGMLIIKNIDIVIFPLLKKQGVYFYIWVICVDTVTLILLDQRTSIVRKMASVCRGELQRWAKAAEPHQRLSYQEGLLMIAYWIYIIYSALTLIEYVVYHHYGWPPGFFYKTYSTVKTPLNLMELAILFHLAIGRGITLFGRQRMH